MTLEAQLRALIRDAVREELRAGFGAARTATAGAESPPSPGAEPPMTTAEATRYCGFKTSAAIRKAFREGRLVPLGRRGGTGTYMW